MRSGMVYQMEVCTDPGSVQASGRIYQNGGLTMNNLIIRNALTRTGVRAWQVAKHILKVSEPTYFRMMRNELPKSEQKKIAAAIEEYAAKGGREHE